MKIPFDRLESFMADVLVCVGVPKEDADICAEVLITADKLGIDSHGINRFKQIYYDRIKAGVQKPVTEFEIVKETPTTAVIDGHHGMGMVISKRAMQMAIDKAKNYGMAMTVVRNSTHYGIAGYYGLMAEKQGMIGITGTNARPSIAPTWGVENMLGTNPLTFVMPTDEDFPFFLDCATSVSQRGKVERYAKEGRDIPKGWVVDNTGKYRTDSDGILKDLLTGDCSFVPLGGMGEETGGYKGYGYAAVVEILSAALCQGAFMKMLTGYEGKKRVPYSLGHFFMAIDIESFTPLDDFKKTAGDILRALRRSQKAPGAERIYTPGEKEYIEKNKRDSVTISDELLDEIKQISDETGIRMDKLKKV